MKRLGFLELTTFLKTLIYIDMEEIKLKCSRCKEFKLADKFSNKIQPDSYLNQRSKDWYCKECRRIRSSMARYPDICSECGNYAKVHNKKCQRCWIKTGLRYCNECKEFKLLIDYYPKRAECKVCYGKHQEKIKLKIEKRLKKQETIDMKYECPQCFFSTKKPTDINGLCHKCNKKLGMKQCQKCRELKFIHSDFKDKKQICIDCSS